MKYFAHGTPTRVQSRTQDWPYRAVLVRFCTLGARACAFPDTRRPIRAVTRPFVHTGRPRVCKVGHKIGRIAPFLSVFAHCRVPRVHKRTRRRARSSGAPACASSRRPTSPRGRPKRYLLANKGCQQPLLCGAGPVGAFRKQLDGMRGHPGANLRCARRRNTGRSTRQARNQGVRAGVCNAQLIPGRPTGGSFSHKIG